IGDNLRRTPRGRAGGTIRKLASGTHIPAKAGLGGTKRQKPQRGRTQRRDTSTCILSPAIADPTMLTAPIGKIGVCEMVHVGAVAGIIAPAPSPGGAGIRGKSDEDQGKPARSREQCRKLFH